MQENSLAWKKQLARIGLVLLGLVILLGLNYLLTQRSDQRNNDYGQFWLAGYLLGHGQSPYDIEATQALREASGMWRGREAFVGSVYPLWTIFLFALLGQLPIDLAAAVWLTLNQVFIAISFYLLGKTLTKDLPPPAGSKLFRALFRWGFLPFLGSFAFTHCLLNGQLSIFLTTGIILFIYGAAHQRYALAGFGLLVAIYKPTTVALFAPFALLWLLVAKPRRPGIYVFAASASFLVGLGFLIEPAMLGKIYTASEGRSDVLRLGTVWSVGATLARLSGLPEIIGWIFAGFLGLFCAFAGWYYMRRLPATPFRFVAIWGFIYAYVISFSWYALSYEAVGFFPLIMVVVAMAQTFNRSEQIITGIGFFLTFYFFPYALKLQSVALDEFRTGINVLLALAFYLAVLAYYHFKLKPGYTSSND